MSGTFVIKLRTLLVFVVSLSVVDSAFFLSTLANHNVGILAINCRGDRTKRHLQPPSITPRAGSVDMSIGESMSADSPTTPSRGIKGVNVSAQNMPGKVDEECG